jgi:TolB-like protein
MPQTADVFISYSREDKDRVIDLAQKLREAGVSLWIDQGGIDGAAMWSEEIVNALENSKVLMLMVSERAVTSHNVTKEVTIASERKGHILPVHLEPTRIPAGLKYALAGIQHIEYFAAEPAESLKSILRSLERLGVTLQPPPAVSAMPQSTSSHSMHSETGFEALGNSIAVLPFENLSSDKETDYFSDGLTEELIASLSNIKEIEVASRRSSMKYKGTDKDDRTIGRELGARYLAGGSVRKFGENIRISAQLVDAESNRQLWAQTYKGKLDDIFDIQEQVGQQIAESLKLKLSLTEKVGLTKRSTVNAQAYDLYLRGKEYLYQLTKKSVEYSIQLFEKAIELDPRYASAYGACSSAYGLLYTLFRREEPLKETAQELGLKALMYDKDCADAYAALALTNYYRRMYDEAASAGKMALELSPDSFLPYWLVGRVYIAMGLYVEAQQLLERSIAMEPEFYTAFNDLELTYKALGLTERAQEMHQKLLAYLPTHLLKYPDDSRARMFYAGRLASSGNNATSKVQALEALASSPDDPLMLYNAACVFTHLGDHKLAIATLRSSAEGGYEFFDWIKRDSDLDPIRNDPEYIELMKDK